MFQWIAEVAASPPYQLMADGDEASRIAAERVWPMCYVHVRWKTFFLHQIIIYAFLCRRAVRRKFAPIDAYDNPVFQSLLKDLHTLHLYAVDLEAFCLLYGFFQVIKILLRFRTKLQQCNFFSGNGWRMPLTSGHHGNQKIVELLRDGFKYLSSNWLMGSNGQRVRNWYQGANITSTIRWVMVSHLFCSSLRFGTKKSLRFCTAPPR